MKAMLTCGIYDLWENKHQQNATVMCTVMNWFWHQAFLLQNKINAFNSQLIVKEKFDRNWLGNTVFLWIIKHYFYQWNDMRSNFLAHLSTKCSSELLWSFNVRCPSSVVRLCVRPCVNNFFKQHLLWNRLLDFDQTSKEWSLGGPLSKLFKPFKLVA